MRSQAFFQPGVIHSRQLTMAAHAGQNRETHWRSPGAGLAPTGQRHRGGSRCGVVARLRERIEQVVSRATVRCGSIRSSSGPDGCCGIAGSAPACSCSARGLSRKTAWAGVHGGHQLEARRKTHAVSRSRYHDKARLPLARVKPPAPCGQTPGNSSRNKTPWWASVISPGCGLEPPPTNAGPDAE